MSLKYFSKKKTFFIVTGAVNEKNGANGSMLDVVLALKKSYNVNVITIARPLLIGLIESLLHSRFFSYSISLFPIYQFILNKPSGIFLVANTTEDQILYFKNKYPNAKLMIFQTGDIKNNTSVATKMNLVDRILFQSPGQMDTFVKIYSKYKDKALLLRPTIKEDKFLKYDNQQYNADLIKDNKEIIFTIIGSIQDRKNQLQAIKFCQILYEKYNINLKLFVVGPFVDNEYKKIILDFVKTHKLEDLIIFTGFKKNYADYLCNAHIVLSVSKEEGLSTIIRESLYLGKIIIASNISGNIGTLNKYNSILFDLNTSNERIVKDVYEILLNQVKTYAIMSNTKKKYLENHSNLKYNTSIKELLSDALLFRAIIGN